MEKIQITEQDLQRLVSEVTNLRVDASTFCEEENMDLEGFMTLGRALALEMKGDSSTELDSEGIFAYGAYCAFLVGWKAHEQYRTKGVG